MNIEKGGLSARENLVKYLLGIKEKEARKEVG